MPSSQDHGNDDKVGFGSGGLVYNILFNKEGYTPHYANDLRDPLDQGRKLVMFDPHTQEAAFIYDLQKKEIEWEVSVPGGAVANPHQGFLLPTDIPKFGKKGDICCTDKDNNIIVINRERKEITFQKKPAEWSPEWLHCVHLASDGSSLIATDYLKKGGVIAKLTVPGLQTVWRRDDLRKPSKVSTIRGKGYWHNPSFGGEYLICANRPMGPVVEIRDADGKIVWQNPGNMGKNDICGEGSWVGMPHSAFRLGRVEGKGSVTVVGGESGGGIVGVSYTGEPLFGIPQHFLRRADGSVQYYFNSYLLSEVTHVFPTLTGRIGFISWSGWNSSLVGEITRFPRNQEVSFCLAFDRESQEDFTDLEPITSAGWDEIHLGIRNTGKNPLDYEVVGYMTPSLLKNTPPDHGRFRLFSGTLSEGENVVKHSFQPFSFHVVRIRSTNEVSPTDYSVYVIKSKS